MKEFIDNNDEYIPSERKYANEILDVRIYCAVKGCNYYIKGKEAYNGVFLDELGNYVADLRSQEWKCNKHSNNK